VNKYVDGFKRNTKVTRRGPFEERVSFGRKIWVGKRKTLNEKKKENFDYKHGRDLREIIGEQGKRPSKKKLNTRGGSRKRGILLKAEKGKKNMSFKWGGGAERKKQKWRGREDLKEKMRDVRVKEEGRLPLVPTVLGQKATISGLGYEGAQGGELSATRGGRGKKKKKNGGGWAPV